MQLLSAVVRAEIFVSRHLPGARLIYVDYTHVVKDLLGSSKHDVGLPHQGIVGDCWLLSVFVSLSKYNPRLFEEWIELHPTYAIVHFPKRPLIKLDYIFPVINSHEHIGVKFKTNSDIYWMLLEKAFCIHLHCDSSMRDKVVRHRLKREFPLYPWTSDYCDLHGGSIHDAVSLLLATIPRLPVCYFNLNLNQYSDKIKKGLFLLEITRGKKKHSLSLLDVRLKDNRPVYISWDTWGEFNYSCDALIYYYSLT